MTCTITQADLGPLFADVNATLAEMAIAAASGFVLGYDDAKYASWIECGIDPCLATKLLAQHTLAIMVGAGSSTGSTVTSESVKDVSASYASPSSASIWGTTPFGLLYAAMRDQYEQCRSRRRYLPIGARRGCGCT